MYQQVKNELFGGIVEILRLFDKAHIPLDPANTDYQQFKKDVAGGVELQDPEGNVMTQEQVDDFLKTIP